MIRNPDHFKSFEMDDDKISKASIKDNKSIVSSLLSNQVLASHSWSCKVALVFPQLRRSKAPGAGPPNTRRCNAAATGDCNSAQCSHPSPRVESGGPVNVGHGCGDDELGQGRYQDNKGKEDNGGLSLSKVGIDRSGYQIENKIIDGKVKIARTKDNERNEVKDKYATSDDNDTYSAVDIKTHADARGQEIQFTPRSEAQQTLTHDYHDKLADTDGAESRNEHDYKNSCNGSVAGLICEGGHKKFVDLENSEMSHKRGEYCTNDKIQIFEKTGPPWEADESQGSDD